MRHTLPRSRTAAVTTKAVSRLVPPTGRSAGRRSTCAGRYSEPRSECGSRARRTRRRAAAPRTAPAPRSSTRRNAQLATGAGDRDQRRVRLRTYTRRRGESRTRFLCPTQGAIATLRVAELSAKAQPRHNVRGRFTRGDARTYPGTGHAALFPSHSDLSVTLVPTGSP